MEELLKVSEVAELLGIDETTVRRWEKMGILPQAIKLPRVGVGNREGRRFRKEEILKVLPALKKSPGS